MRKRNARNIFILLIINIGFVSPVIAQGKLILQPESSDGKDAFIWYIENQNGQYGPTSITNYGSNHAFLAHEWTWKGDVGSRKSLIEFDISMLPSNVTITDARLSLFAFPNSADGGHSTLSGSNECFLQRITSNWSEETVTWNNQPSVTTLHQVTLESSTSADQDYLNIDVTAIVEDMYSNPASSHGFMLSMSNPNHYRAMIFASSDHSDREMHPKLEITYNCDESIEVDLGNDTTLCQGQNLLLDATLPNASYVWQDGSALSTFNVVSSGIYWVDVATCAGVYRDSIEISFDELPPITINTDTTFCSGDSVIFDVSNLGTSYLWQDGSTESNLKVMHGGKYWVQISSENCSSLRMFNLMEIDCEINLILPNLFTPNGDGINDIFIPIESKGITSMKTIILNRWGQKIFSTSNVMIEWDSIMNNGNIATNGVYFYLVKYSDLLGNDHEAKGYLTILR